MRKRLCGTLLAICIMVGAVLLPTATVSAQAACTSANHFFWLPKAGNDANSGTTRETPVLTMPKAEALAASGGGCIYLVSGQEDIFVKQVNATVSPGGIPLAPALVYGLLVLLAALLIAGGLWMRQQAMRLQPSVTS